MLPFLPAHYNALLCYDEITLPSTLVGNSNDPPRKYCILDVIKRLINQSRLVKTGRNWSKLVETGWNWSKLSKLVETCNGLPCSKTNRTFIWTFLNLIFLLSDTSNHGWHSMFYESLIILNISTLNFSEGVPAKVLWHSKLFIFIFAKNFERNYEKKLVA